MNELRVPALEVEQSPGRKLYTFIIDGKRVPEFATVSRVRREEGSMQGYQRPEQLAHVANIRAYVESERPLIPNAVVLAFDSRVRYEGGHLVIPLVSGVDAPGFIVDGQQRLAAVREAQVAHFPMVAAAFIAESMGEQAEQFILVNSTKPIPKGLIYELLPSTEAHLPPAFERKRLPATIVERLNLDASSPLRGLIITATNPAAAGAKANNPHTGVLKDTSLLNALGNSLTDGALYPFTGRGERAADMESMVELVGNFWRAVKETWPDAWGKRPKESRLFHGAGVVALSLLMDTICGLRKGDGRLSAEDFAAQLALVAEDCHWTNGAWDFGPGRQRKWNELQNTSKDTDMLSSYLTAHYQARVKPRGGRHGRA